MDLFKGHSEWVADLMYLLGYFLGYDDEFLKHCRRAGLLHDIGKNKIPNQLLAKESPLTEDEITTIKEHATFSYEYCRVNGENPIVSIGVQQHHENYDGSGYPHCIGGMRISLIGRMLRICDVYAALREERPYKKALSLDETLYDMDMMRRMFDPHLYDTFCGMIRGVEMKRQVDASKKIERGA